MVDMILMSSRHPTQQVSRLILQEEVIRSRYQLSSSKISWQLQLEDLITNEVMIFVDEVLALDEHLLQLQIVTTDEDLGPDPDQLIVEGKTEDPDQGLGIGQAIRH